MADGLLAMAFVLPAAVSLATSWLLVARLERIGARFGLSEALLGMLAPVADKSYDADVGVDPWPVRGQSHRTRRRVQ